MKTIEETREALARYSHDSAWSGWMKYQFTKAPLNPDGSWTMPAQFVERWQRQMNTAYDELSDSEKRSDLNEADEMMIVSELDTIRVRLTLTEAALSAAGELLSMSTDENNYLSAFSTCDICNAPTWSGHEETCEYRIAKERYQAAREALEKVTK